jgi:gliding motility-associated-like protein
MPRSLAKIVTIVVEIPCADFTVPNIFTPNNDGINDDFVINILNPATYSIAIYDRWGKVVYTSTDPTVYWNGKLLNTDYMVPDAVYYYIIKASCGTNNYLKKGFVQVVGEQ